MNRIWAGNALGPNVLDPDTTSPGKFESGYGLEAPFYQHWNFILKRAYEGIVYLYQNGIGIWDSNTDYGANALATGSDGQYYSSVIANQGNNPVGDDGTYWVTLASIINPSPSTLDATSNEYWVSPGDPTNYVYNVDQWEDSDGATDSIVTSFRIYARADGAPGDWSDAYRPSSLTITVNSGSDQSNFGSLNSNSITVRDTGGASIGSVNFDFNSYGESIEHEIALTFGANDLDQIHLTSFLYTFGPIIESIVFNP